MKPYLAAVSGARRTTALPPPDAPAGPPADPPAAVPAARSAPGTTGGGPDALRRWAAALAARGPGTLHLVPGAAPTLRTPRGLEELAEPPLPAGGVAGLLVPLLSPRHRDRFAAQARLSTVLDSGAPGAGRCRLDLYRQQGGVSAVLRLVPDTPSLDGLGLPAVLASFALARSGLLVVSGGSGSGVTTTVAALLDAASRGRSGSIVSYEDPIEYPLAHRRSLVSQLEVGIDTAGFAADMPAVLRRDPDVLAVGCLTDAATAAVALEAAEDGRLVIGTARTAGAARTVADLLRALPGEPELRRERVAAALLGVVGQRLLPRADGTGPVAVVDLLVGTDAVRELVRRGALARLAPAVDTVAGAGIVPADGQLLDLLREGVVDAGTALAACRDPAAFRRMAEFRAPGADGAPVGAAAGR